MKFKTKPLPYQQRVFDESKDEPYWANLLDMGLGKTLITIMNASYLAHKGEINALLVIAPNNVHYQWGAQQIPEHWPDDVPYQSVIWRSSRKTKVYQKQLEALLKPSGEVKILLLNVQAMHTKTGVAFVRKFLKKWPDNMVVMDESSNIKNVGSTQTKNIVKLRPLSKYRRILTGTPITQNPMDAYPQCYFLHPELLGFNSFVAYRSRYAIVVEGHSTNKHGRLYTYPNIVGYRRLEELQEKIARKSSRLLKEDHLDIPDKVYQEIPILLKDNQRRIYNKLRDQLLLECQDEDIPVEMALTKLTRLQQLTGGFVGQEDGTVMPLPGPNVKLQTLLEDIETLPVEDKIIIWCRFVPEIELITQALKDVYGHKSVGAYYGAINQELRAETIDKLTDGPVRFFVANPQCAGIGLNLTAANIVYYYSNSFNAEERWQSEDRVHRFGQKKHVLYKDLVCVDTTDVQIKNVLLQKKDVADIITGDNLRRML